MIDWHKIFISLIRLAILYLKFRKVPHVIVKKYDISIAESLLRLRLREGRARKGGRRSQRRYADVHLGGDARYRLRPPVNRRVLPVSLLSSTGKTSTWLLHAQNRNQRLKNDREASCIYILYKCTMSVRHLRVFQCKRNKEDTHERDEV